MEDSSPAKVKAAKEDIRDWEQELKRVQALGLLAAERDKLKSSEIPVLEKQIQEKEAELPSATKEAEKVRSLLPREESYRTNLGTSVGIRAFERG